MKELLISTISQIFKIYNYNFNVDSSEVKIISKTKTHPNIFRLKFDEKNCNYILSVSCCIKISTNSYESYQITTNINRIHLPYKQINYIGESCLGTLKAFYYAYKQKTIDKSALSILIEKNIESCIISIMIRSKTNMQPHVEIIESVSKLLENLIKWSYKTYEGRKIPFSLLLNLDENNFPINLRKICLFLEDDSSALLTDGITSYFAIGSTIEYKVISSYIEKAVKIPLVPYRFSGFANICNKNKIGIILTIQGDILFIKAQKLLFAKRNGDWHAYDYDTFNTVLFHDTSSNIDMEERKTNGKDRNIKIKEIYLTCLDVAFARTGGCLAICSEENVRKIRSSVPIESIHKPFIRKKDNNVDSKRHILENVVINKSTFYKLERKARQELLGIDGATIILPNGRFYTTGTIINNNIKQKHYYKHGGARTQAAIKLSNYGIAIKISADGYIECYKNMEHIL